MRTVVDFVLRMVLENPLGDTRESAVHSPISGARLNVAPSQTSRKENEVEPAPERDAHIGWSRFLDAHCEYMATTDFLSVEVYTIKGLSTHHILFSIDIASRTVHVAGITACPANSWMTQAVRNVTDANAALTGHG